MLNHDMLYKYYDSVYAALEGFKGFVNAQQYWANKALDAMLVKAEDKK